MKTKAPSERLLARLPIYLTYIKSLPDSTVNISATKLASALGYGDVLVRKDLAKISDGGRRKLGYVRQDLIRDIELFLDYNSATTAVIVGVDRISLSLTDYFYLEHTGLNLLAGFDLSSSIHETEKGLPVYAIDQLDAYCNNYDISIGIIAVPKARAQEACDRLIACGIHAIWNLSPAHLTVPSHVVLQSTNWGSSLASLRMQIKARTQI